jgi:hypothetical protein
MVSIDVVPNKIKKYRKNVSLQDEVCAPARIKQCFKNKRIFYERQIFAFFYGNLKRKARKKR